MKKEIGEKGTKSRGKSDVVHETTIMKSYIKWYELNMTGEIGQGWRLLETEEEEGGQMNRDNVRRLVKRKEEEWQAQRKVFTERAERQYYLTLRVTAWRRLCLFY